MTRAPRLDVGFLDEGVDARAVSRHDRNRSLAVPVAIIVVWLVAVTAWGHWGRVADHFAAAITMVFGSFVAGSTPQGGGAVAFPVLTKALSVPSSVARSFSLSIQAVGMGSAAIVMILGRRRVVWRAVAIVAPIAVGSFLVSLILLSDRATPFWESRLPGPYVKVTFTIVVAAMAWLVYLGSKIPIRQVDYVLPTENRRVVAGLVMAAVLGGLASALVGSGADVFLYLMVVVMLGVDPRVGVPTSVVVMATVSVVGFVVLGLIDGQLFVDVAGQDVVGVGGTAVDPLPLREADLFGMWIAAVPVVAVGAPLGSWVASGLDARRLAYFVLSLAALEVVTTIVFLDELHSDPGLIALGAVGLVVLIPGLGWLARHRQRLFDLPPFDASRTLRRPSVDVAPDYATRLDGPG